MCYNENEKKTIMFCQLLVYHDTKLTDFWLLEQNELQYW